MDIMELIDDREQTVAESSPRPFCCPEHSCHKVDKMIRRVGRDTMPIEFPEHPLKHTLEFQSQI